MFLPWRMSMPPAFSWMSVALICALTLSTSIDGGVARAQEDLIAETSVAQAWLDGKLDYPKPLVTYDGPPIRVRYATYLTAANGLEKVMAQALQVLERESNGKFRTEAYYGEALHPQNQGFVAVRHGVVELSACFSIYEPTSMHALEAMSLPFTLLDGVKGTRILAELYPKYFKAEYERMGVYLARAVVTSNYQIMGMKPLARQENLKGQLIRPSSIQMGYAFEKLGAASVVNLPTGQSYEALQRGLIDATSLSDSSLFALHIHELAKYHLDLDMFTQDLEFCMNRQFFDRLPPDLQQVLYQWNQKAAMALAQLFYARSTSNARRAFVKAGVEMMQLTPEERERWQTAIRPVVDDWIRGMEERGYPARQLLAAFKEKEAEYKSKSYNDLMWDVIRSPISGLVDFGRGSHAVE